MQVAPYGSAGSVIPLNLAVSIRVQVVELWSIRGVFLKKHLTQSITATLQLWSLARETRPKIHTHAPHEYV